MKKIKIKLLESKTILTESMVDSLFTGAPKGWYDKFRMFMGAFHNNEIRNEWNQYFSSKFPSFLPELQKSINDPSTPKGYKKEMEKVYRNITGGFSYYVNKYFGPAETKKLYKMKIEQYLKSVPKEHVDYLLSNLDLLEAITLETKVPSPEFDGLTGLYAQIDDWFMFGDGFKIAMRAFREAEKTTPYDKFVAPEQQQAPVEHPASNPEMDSKLRSQADLINSFYSSGKKK